MGYSEFHPALEGTAMPPKGHFIEED